MLSDGQGSKGHWLVANSKSVSASLSLSANWGILQLRDSIVMAIRQNCIFKGHSQEGALRWNLTATTKSVALMSCFCFSLGNWLSLHLEKNPLLGNVLVSSSCLASRWPFVRKLEDAESKNLSTNCDALRKSRIESSGAPGLSVSAKMNSRSNGKKGGQDEADCLGKDVWEVGTWALSSSWWRHLLPSCTLPRSHFHMCLELVDMVTWPGQQSTQLCTFAYLATQSDKRFYILFYLP